MHGGANSQHPAMHGGGVGCPRGRWLASGADVDPAFHHGGLEATCRESWRDAVNLPRHAWWQGQTV